MLKAQMFEHVGSVNFRHRCIGKLPQVGTIADKIDLRPGLHIEYLPIGMRDLAADIEAARFDLNGEKLELPVKLKVHDSIFVPLAKWSMLIAGNYRCVQKDAARSIKEAVHTDIEATRAVYNWVKTLCIDQG